MSRAASDSVLTLDDAGLEWADAAGVQATSPGVAVAAPGGLLFGADAAARARANPRQTFDRYWQRLDQQPLSRPAQEAHSHADLAYFHLRALWGESPPQSLLLGAPAAYGRAQLELLLGVAAASGAGVAGLFSLPVAAAAAVPGGGDRLLLHAQLHSLRATRVQAAGAMLRLEESWEVAPRGLDELHDAWAAKIASAFVHETRFDPLHDAAAEQALYDRLPEWVSALNAAARVRLSLEYGGRSHAVTLGAAALEAAAEVFYAPLAEATAAAGDARVLLDCRLAGLPGLVRRLAGVLGRDPEIVPRGAAAAAALRHAEAIRSQAEAPAFVTALPLESALESALESTVESAMASATALAEDPAEVGSQPAQANVPSHVLHRGRARRIAETGMDLPLAAPALHIAWRGQAPVLEALSGELRVNGAPLGAAGAVRALAVGDEIETGGERYFAILVESGDA